MQYIAVGKGLQIYYADCIYNCQVFPYYIIGKGL